MLVCWQALVEVTRKGGKKELVKKSAVLAAMLMMALVGLVIPAFAQTAPPEGVQYFEVPSQYHTEGPVLYEPVPPVGGDHNPVLQNCGFYDSPVRNENAVHSLEHGAVWITYSPDLPVDQVETLRTLASGHTHVLVSPYPGLPAPVVASAWGVQLMLEGAYDPRLEQFVSAYEQGPQNPEPGAPCSGGIGEPQ
jgi:hypothetical protein